jgi:RNA 2',3'-cyclic 3'-phosphodiesterase
MRLFVAVEIEPEIRKRIEAFMQQWKTKISSARWVRPEGLHITLKFLGNVADERRSGIERALAQIHAPRFPVSLKGIGVFPNPKSPRVLWVGISAGEEFAGLASKVDEQMAIAGFDREKRAFSPHVTLARFKERTKKTEIESAVSVPESNFGTMTAKEFHLYESKLSPQGSVYKQLSTFGLI